MYSHLQPKLGDVTTVQDAPDEPGDQDGNGTGAGRDAEARALEFCARSAEGTLIERMGIEFVQATSERVVATMPVAGNTQPYGLLHGGAHVVLAETLGSIAAGLRAGPDKRVVGIELNASHSAGVNSGLVTGTATAVHTGRTLMTHQVRVTDERGKLLSTIRITNMVLDPPAARVR